MRNSLLNQRSPFKWREILSQRLNRLERVLNYIEANISGSLSVEHLARQSCWSRWQLQRVFLLETGLSIAQYIRQLRLSIAADLLLTTPDRHVDIALNCGFESEISFSRSFKQLFDCSPSQYRKNKQRMGLLMPLAKQSQTNTADKALSRLIKVRIETKPAFEVQGINCTINGLFSKQPNFSEKVPQLWQKFEDIIHKHMINIDTRLGIIAVSQAEENLDNMPYWAGFDSSLSPNLSSNNLQILTIPEQLYAVIEHIGPISDLPNTLDWFICHWLPESDYSSVDAFDLEHYDSDFDMKSNETRMEYWLPVKRREVT